MSVSVFKLTKLNTIIQQQNRKTIFLYFDCIESLRFLRSSKVNLGQGLLRKGKEGYPISIYLLLNCLSMLLKTGLSISTALEFDLDLNVNKKNIDKFFGKNDHKNF